MPLQVHCAALVGSSLVYPDKTYIGFCFTKYLFLVWFPFMDASTSKCNLFCSCVVDPHYILNFRAIRIILNAAVFWEATLFSFQAKKSP